MQKLLLEKTSKELKLDMSIVYVMLVIELFTVIQIGFLILVTEHKMI